jgi:Protein of unknown function (DUF1524)
MTAAGLFPPTISLGCEILRGVRGSWLLIHRMRMAKWRLAGVLLLVAVVVSVPVNPVIAATPPAASSESAARAELAHLRVAPDGPFTGYSRDRFPHWATITRTCDTRETVLKRDGISVTTDSSCAAVSGRWVSPYDGATWTTAADVDIDHVVPLANAWRTGAATWPASKRREFANDLTNPQLIAVTDNVNQAKGDQTPATWKPPLVTYWCTYATMWVQVKHRYTLSITAAEKSALTGMLDRC